MSSSSTSSALGPIDQASRSAVLAAPSSACVTFVLLKSSSVPAVEHDANVLEQVFMVRVIELRST